MGFIQEKLYFSLPTISGPGFTLMVEHRCSILLLFLLKHFWIDNLIAGANVNNDRLDEGTFAIQRPVDW